MVAAVHSISCSGAIAEPGYKNTWHRNDVPAGRCVDQILRKISEGLGRQLPERGDGGWGMPEQLPIPNRRREWGGGRRRVMLFYDIFLKAPEENVQKR